MFPNQFCLPRRPLDYPRPDLTPLLSYGQSSTLNVFYIRCSRMRLDKIHLAPLPPLSLEPMWQRYYSAPKPSIASLGTNVWYLQQLWKFFGMCDTCHDIILHNLPTALENFCHETVWSRSMETMAGSPTLAGISLLIQFVVKAWYTIWVFFLKWAI